MENKRNTRLEVYKLIEINKTSKEIANILNVTVRTVERYRKEYKKATEESDIKATTTKAKKRIKEIAKAKIITGSTIKEVAEELGQAKSVIGDISSQNNLQEAQKEFLNRFREEQAKEIEERKKERLAFNKKLLKAISNINIYTVAELKNMQETLLKNELTEQEILELDRIERLERLELEKAKLNTDTQDSKLIEVLDTLESNL